MTSMRSIVWSRFAVVCQSCRRRFRIDMDALADARTRLGPEESDDTSDRELAMGIECCLECTGGMVDTGEFIDENPHARRWDPKGWALETLAAMAREVLCMIDCHVRDRQWYETRMKRRAAVACALRDRIDGRC